MRALRRLCRVAASAGQHRHDCATISAERGETREIFKGVAAGRAHGAFQGRITVRPGAQKVDAHMLSRNLLLGARAAIDTKPELEIFADDVKCSHGAAVGDLDEAALFYLLARGIPREEARHMLIEAFIARGGRNRRAARQCASICWRGSPAAWRCWRTEHDDGKPAEFRPSGRAPAGRVRPAPAAAASSRSSPTIPVSSFSTPGASAQKPASVIDRIADYYRTDYANVHRGVYRLSARSTELFEEARVKAQRFLNAADPREIVFVRGATEAINLVAQSWGGAFLEAGDEVVISELEHHSNIVPWQMLRDRIGIRIVVAPIDATGGLDLAAFAARLSPRTRLVAITHLANATGALVPVETIVELAHRVGARVLVDGCQAAPRLPVDVQALGCDFYAFSGHKTYGPTGIGVLVGPPRIAGGDAALAGRRRDDPQRHLREDRCTRSRRIASRPAPPTFRARSGSARRSISSRGWGATTSSSTRRR